MLPRFHLAVPVDDLGAAKEFYGSVLGCQRGRSSDRWQDWDFRGHQLVTHLVERPVAADGTDSMHNPVDGHDVPVPHFGLLLSVDDFHELADRLRRGGTDFVVEPYRRFEGLPAEQWTMFVYDPAGNALEFKAFADDAAVFAAD